LLCSVDDYGYGNWDQVRKELREDEKLLFQHTLHGMNTDSISKRCDYRMRQLERELEIREKKLKSQKPATVIAAENILKSIVEMDDWDVETTQRTLLGDNAPSLERLSEEAKKYNGRAITRTTNFDR